METPQPLTEEAAEMVAARFRALGEVPRLKILTLLEEGPASVSQVAGRLGLSQPNASRHLKILQEAGLVSRRQEGNTVYYTAEPVVSELCQLMCRDLRGRLQARARALGA
ncbi:MAG TPA: metalloregulator ArsR/SmtB family transcription factor [Candidatus Nitrosotenuis sp.]|jgi:DNA-binding transcriptional ArsR family regulator|nr:metalloregulator ArsR/SmtB family transcription factor [Candidatus Nitrosotenuis sp.]